LIAGFVLKRRVEMRSTARVSLRPSSSCLSLYASHGLFADCAEYFGTFRLIGPAVRDVRRGFECAFVALLLESSFGKDM
jgi:hypothetical protein